MVYYPLHPRIDAHAETYYSYFQSSVTVGSHIDTEPGDIVTGIGSVAPLLLAGVTSQKYPKITCTKIPNGLKEIETLSGDGCFSPNTHQGIQNGRYSSILSRP